LFGGAKHIKVPRGDGTEKVQSFEHNLVHEEIVRILFGIDLEILVNAMFWFCKICQSFVMELSQPAVQASF